MAGWPTRRVAVVGSRRYPRPDLVVATVYALPPESIVITGGAPGVDTWAEATARARGLRLEVYRPDWQTFGRSAGLKRNAVIVSNADRVIAFWDGHSRGTAHTIGLARKVGKPVEVIR